MEAIAGRPVAGYAETSFSFPAIYGRSTFGIVTEPSAFWYSSRIGIRILGLAITVLLSVWQKTFFLVAGSL